MKKKILSLLVIMLIMILGLAGCGLDTAEDVVVNQSSGNEDTVSVLKSTKDINLHDLDGKKTNYAFTYKNETFSAKYTKDNWKIIDSYKITNANDIGIICKALIDVHPIHGRDMKSYRTVDDLVYEWQQHNLAYNLLPDDNSWRSHAKDVDLDPADQGKSLAEIYEARTGSKLDVKKLKKLKNNSKVQRVKNSSKFQKLKNKIKEFLK
ncbi:MAG: hypothetical protein K6B70_08310 [Clostridia bacterium]|nr:hypothetical protein [Clostridia bacterium]